MLLPHFCPGTQNKSQDLLYIVDDSRSGLAPESVCAALVSGWDPPVAGPGPEPPVNVDRLEDGVLAALALEVALAARSVDGRDFVYRGERNLGKQNVTYTCGLCVHFLFRCGGVEFLYEK